MMRDRFFFTIGGFIFVASSVLPVWASDTISIPNGDQDAVIYDDLYDHGWPVQAIGDFNGDGRDDSAITFGGTVSGVYHQDLCVLFGGNRSGATRQSAEPRFQVTLDGSFAVSDLSLADINGDGKDDLVVSVINPYAPTNGVFVFFGRTQTGSVDFSQFDLHLTPPGEEDRFGAVLGKGDFNGDGIDDLIISAPDSAPRGKAYLVKGRRSFVSGTTLNVPAEADATLVLKSATGSDLFLWRARTTGNGKDDLIVSETSPDWWDSADPQEVSIFRNGDWPTLWDVENTSASFSIRSSPDYPGVICLAAGDFTGDGIADLHLEVWAGHAILDGVNMATGGSADLYGALTEPLQSLPFSGEYPTNAMADYDGDGRDDITFLWSDRLDLFLSSDYPAGRMPTLGTASLEILSDNTIVNVRHGDINGDGIQDLVTSGFPEGALPAGDPVYGMTCFFYGFRPLSNPSVTISPRSAGSSRVGLELRVGGDPTEMSISGDISDAIKGQWIPFQSSLAVTLTPALGDKTVRATFRNGYPRGISATAQDTQTLAGGDSDLTEVTNRIRAPGSKTRIDCRLRSSGRLVVRVVSVNGEEVRRVCDQELEAGIHPVEWDGTAEDGRRVVPGVYLLMVDANGARSTKKVLVGR